MKSQNFEFLRPTWPELATLAGFAEQYAVADPSSGAVKLRSFAEQIVDFVFHRHGIPRPFQPNLNDMLESHSFGQAVPRVVIAKLHALRIHGNKAAHGTSTSVNTSNWLLREAFDLARWVSMTYAAVPAAGFPDFVEPGTGADSESKQQLKREKKAVLEKLAAQEAEMQQLLGELEAARTKATQAEATAAEFQATFANAQRAADVLSFSEATTRKRLIDTMLISAGWDVGADGATTSEVAQELEVGDQPTDTGKGYVDYVLRGDDGKPLGIIEAKKTSRSADEGRTQAVLYANALDKMTGQRPVIFCTNGYETTIWNDGDKEPPRPVYGFPAAESLRTLIYRRTNREPASSIAPNPKIADRMYQIEAVKRVVERFAAKHRRALIVQATGTGKTRVAVSLCDALIRAKWAKRILFLCDRRELRKQAHNAFKQFLPSEPRTFVTGNTYQDRDSRIYLATYPAMMKCFETFDVGFFDLIIADESHRSIYNRYRDLFLYFDALQVGLTATPVDFISRNTYELFRCENQDPTAHFGFKEAINHVPPYLTPFKVETHTTPFLREGIKYSQMNEAQRQQLEDGEVEPERIEFDPHQVDKQIFNKDTNRQILRNLMERGIKIKDGSQIGKTIIFARSHNHAVLLENLFNEMYPQYGGKFCRVIDNYDVRAEELIDDFKGDGTNPDLTIAISVDMLDTGIDVPEIVNLVFAKPVYSFVKFWQMIGRGTRLRPELFGPGKDKTHFIVFDHWKNFEFFDVHYQQTEPTAVKSLLQRLFESRITLADTALAKPDVPVFDLAVKLLGKDIADLPEKTIAVREKWKQFLVVKNGQTLKQFEPATRAVLMQDIAPLMQWRDIAGDESAYGFDALICKMQTELLRQSGRFEDLKDQMQALLDELQMNLNQVKARAETIAKVRTQSFWDTATVGSLETVREELRGVMRYRIPSATAALPPKVIDVAEDESLIERREYKPKLEGLELAAYRKRVEQVLNELFATNDTLKRIKSGDPVGEDDLRALVSLVLTQHPDLDLSDLTEYYPETAGHLDLAIRSIIGLDADAVHDRFSKFVQKHPTLNSRQIKFLDLLQNYIGKYGAIEVGRLYEEPFTALHSDGPDGLFQDDSQMNDLIAVIESFSPAPGKSATEGKQ